MTENVENLVLEQLRAIRSDIASVKDDTRDIMARLNNIENGIVRITREESSNYGEIVQDRHIVDKLKERIERIEKRLELNG